MKYNNYKQIGKKKCKSIKRLRWYQIEISLYRIVKSVDNYLTSR